MTILHNRFARHTFTVRKVHADGRIETVLGEDNKPVRIANINNADSFAEFLTRNHRALPFTDKTTYFRAGLMRVN